MKYRLSVLIVFIVFVIIFPIVTLASETSISALKLSSEETQWLESNKDRTFTLEVLPQAGFEYFNSNGNEDGFMKPLVNKISEDLGVKINLKVSNSWTQIYSALQNGSIDILYGANETAERDKIMAFTKPFLRIPYVILSKKEGPVHTIGDLDNRKVGFMQNDFAIDSLSKTYKNIEYSKMLYSSREAGVEALSQDMIDAFVTAGGPIIYEYIYKYPELSYSFKINSLNSDMTFSTRKADKTLVDILNKEINNLQAKELPHMINAAEVNYNLKVMNLTESERNWLSTDGTAVIGVTKDYLPFDYYENGDYKGIDGSILKEISRMTGIKLKYDYSDFDDLNDKLKKGEINVLNIAKTEERQNYVIYPKPFSTERDIIVGRKDEKEARDIFGLEGKRVAVIKGFWHYNLLNKNLTKVNIIETNNIEESMKLVNDKKADYLIENPSVVKYYTEELEYYDLVQRGTTSTDSFLYFGISKNKPELASIINKLLPMMDIEDLSRKGYEEVPHKDNKQNNQRLILTIIFLVIVLLSIIIYLIKLFKDLIREKTEKELLKQREYLLSIDTLTELHNRNYLASKVLPDIDERPFPQVLLAADVNELKVINDSYGHQAGDMLLKAFAEVLREACKGEAELFRVGGDEFIVLLTNSNEEEAIELVGNIRNAGQTKTLIFKDGKRFYVAAALGYAVRYSKEVTYEELSEIADRNMYYDKRNTKA